MTISFRILLNWMPIFEPGGMSSDSEAELSFVVREIEVLGVDENDDEVG